MYTDLGYTKYSDMSEEYLEPGFDHKSLKVADLKRVLTENKISFPPAAKKAELRQIYNRSIVPMLPRLRSSSSAGGESSAGKDSDESASTSPESSASPPHKRLRDEMEDGEASDGSDAELRSNSTSISNARQISLSSSSEDDNMSSDNSLSNIVTKEPSTPVAKKRKTTSSTSGTPIVNRVKGKTQKYDNKHAPSATSLGLSTSSEDDSMSGISESDDEETSINVRKRGKENVGPKSFDFSVQSKSLAPDLTKMRVSSGFANQLKKAVESNSDMVSPSNSFAANATNESNSGVSAHNTLGIKLSGPPLKFDNLIEISDSSDDNGYDKIMEKFSSQSPPTENAKTNVPTPPVISEEDVRQAEERERALRESILSSESMEGEDQGDKLESVPPVEFGTAEGDPFDIPPVTEPAVVFESDYATHKEPTPEEPALGTSDHGDEREEVEVDVDNEYPANASIDHLDEPEIDLLNKEDNVEEEGIVLDDFDNSDAFHIQESGNIDSKTTHIDLEAKKQSSEETKKDNSEIREEISDTNVKKSPTQKKGRSIMLLVTKKVFRCVVLSATFIVGICAILFALWYREQVVLVGYCGFERRGPSIHDTYPNIDILKKVDDILEQHVPGCIPCPDNSICYPYMKLRCKAGYTLQKAQFGLFGLVPMSDSCVKDDRRDQLVREVVQKSLDFLRTKNAEIACGENKDNIISGISEKDLYNIFSEAKAPWIEDEEYEKIWLQVLQDLESEPEIIMRQVSINVFFFFSNTELLTKFNSYSTMDLTFHSTPTSTYPPMKFKGRRDIFNKQTALKKTDIFDLYPRNISASDVDLSKKYVKNITATSTPSGL